MWTACIICFVVYFLTCIPVRVLLYSEDEGVSDVGCVLGWIVTIPALLGGVGILVWELIAWVNV